MATIPDLAALAGRHDVPLDAVQTLVEALQRGHGRQAQFSHPALGGMGQWSRGGGIMIGAMFDHALKAKVARLCDELAGSVDAGGSVPVAEAGAWWPQGFGRPSATGSQNQHAYACFPEAHRLAIRDPDGVHLYDTGDHRISGVSQQQGGTRDLVFTSQHGPVRLSDLAQVETEAVAPDTGTQHCERQPGGNGADAMVPQSAAPQSDVIGLIERLHDLQRRGILSTEEFAAKKTELLGRL